MRGLFTWKEWIALGANPSCSDPQTDVMVVPLDAASWHAMVERVGEKLAFDGANITAKGWHGDEPLLADARTEIRRLAEKYLRAALNLPNGWTP